VEEIGKIESWTFTGENLAASGQGIARKVTRKTASDGRIHVLKTMQPSQVRRLGRQERFRNETEALRRLDDPHILKIVDYGEDAKGLPYLVTPFCANGTLADHVRPAISVIDTLRMFTGICEGVAHAHSKGIVHRDIKPTNIFLDADNQAIVGDFGLCFLLDGFVEDDGRLTDTMEVAGPRWFGAPEARDGRLGEVTPAGDVYSLGKLLHWMFSRRPFDREDHRSDRNRLGRNLDDRREYELVHEFLDRMIVEQPAKRYQSAELVLHAVDQLTRVLEAKGRPILLDFVHRCDFCGQGQYEFMNGPEDLPKNQEVSNQLGFHSNHRQNPALYKYFFYMIAICNKCSHVQLFRPDMTKGVDKVWMRKSE
jgi:serine/threonine protein kinase